MPFFLLRMISVSFENGILICYHFISSLLLTEIQQITAGEQGIYFADRLGTVKITASLLRSFFFFTKGVSAMKKVGIVMGSDSDLPVVQKAIDTLKAFEVPYEVHIFSAHRTPAEASAFAREAEQNGFGVIIAAAGMAAHLAGALAAGTVLPVIGIPCKSNTLDGIDALLSTVQMPSGIPVATVAINGAVNAALLSIQILALSEPSLSQKLKDKRSADSKAVLEKNAEIASKL